MSGPDTNLSPVEGIKARSRFLRGTIEQSLADSASGALAEDDTQLSKFHGFYQQDDRDVRDDRRRRMQEPDYQFMIRARVPGGICTPKQWLAMDRIARSWANNSLRLTTRQAFQFHGVFKEQLKPSIRAINDCLLDTLAACGDVNRNVMCTPLPELSPLHSEVVALAHAVSDHLSPSTRAYHEIWLDGERVAGSEQEPIYGPSYLPRKFKMAFAIPPRNDVDVMAQDLGFIAVADPESGDSLAGFNVTVGGGMGMTHGDAATYPRLADVIGFCRPDQVIEVSEAVVTLQRDLGDRSERKHARLKYTIDDMGLEAFRQALHERLGFELSTPREFRFSHTGDRFGWQQSADGRWNLGLFIESGRIRDDGQSSQLSGLRAIAQVLNGEFRLTPNQNLIISKVAESERPAIERLVSDHGLDGYQRHSPLKLNSMACVGLPTCGLSMSESERYLPDLVRRVEERLEAHGLSRQAITLRMTGCPNGCARPYLAEIGLVGKGPGLYRLFLGGDASGQRLNAAVAESVDEEGILALLDEKFAAYASQRKPQEGFGDFIHRSGGDHGA